MVLLPRTPSAAVGSSSPRRQDPILPLLRTIRTAYDTLDIPGRCAAYRALLKDCVERFGDDEMYLDDPRLLKIWMLHAEATEDFEGVYNLLEEKGLYRAHAFLYECYAGYLAMKGRILEADKVFRTGIDRRAEPLDKLKRMHLDFLRNMESKVKMAEPSSELQKEAILVEPWSVSTRVDMLKMIDTDMKKYNGYHRSNKVYSGKDVSSKKKIHELGNEKYHVKGCSGTGNFAQVYKACLDSSPEEVVALKIQQPAFPWEFYMYRQLDMRIPEAERQSFGYAHQVHIFPDMSVLVCGYLPYGTLQDAINSYHVVNKPMEEVLCLYYTIEMLRMLETLHDAGIIHGDFKPDNLLICYPREDLTSESFQSETRSSGNQGICLVDWGRGIDTKLFPDGTKFVGDCRTSGFSCVPMQEKRPWTYEVDTYGLCVIAHMMLHGSYLKIEKSTSGAGHQYQPSTPFRRYWNVELWKNLFSTLLNVNCQGNDVAVLCGLRKSFEDYMCSCEKHISRLNELLRKQKLSLCST